MSTPIADDFAAIAAALKRIEEDHAKVPPAPEPQPEPTYGWLGGCHDYDPA